MKIKNNKTLQSCAIKVSKLAAEMSKVQESVGERIANSNDIVSTDSGELVYDFLSTQDFFSKVTERLYDEGNEDVWSAQINQSGDCYEDLVYCSNQNERLYLVVRCESYSSRFEMFFGYVDIVGKQQNMWAENEKHFNDDLRYDCLYKCFVNTNLDFLGTEGQTSRKRFTDADVANVVRLVKAFVGVDDSVLGVLRIHDGIFKKFLRKFGYRMKDFTTDMDGLNDNEWLQDTAERMSNFYNKSGVGNQIKNVFDECLKVIKNSSVSSLTESIGERVADETAGDIEKKADKVFSYDERLKSYAVSVGKKTNFGKNKNGFDLEFGVLGVSDWDDGKKVYEVESCIFDEFRKKVLFTVSFYEWEDTIYCYWCDFQYASRADRDHITLVRPYQSTITSFSELSEEDKRQVCINVKNEFEIRESVGDKIAETDLSDERIAKKTNMRIDYNSILKRFVFDCNDIWSDAIRYMSPSCDVLIDGLMIDRFFVYPPSYCQIESENGTDKYFDFRTDEEINLSEHFDDFEFILECDGDKRGTQFYKFEDLAYGKQKEIFDFFVSEYESGFMKNYEKESFEKNCLSKTERN